MKEVLFERIAIQNFLSVGEEPVVVDFFKGLHVLTGRNLDKPERANAIGKSTIADAVYFVVLGETLRPLKKDLISNNITGGKTHVELDFQVHSPQGNNKFKVVRTLSPAKLYVYKDGVDKTRDTIANTTKYICDVLSASPSIFQNCVIMTVNNATPFMAKNKVEKRKFIEDIFCMEVFSKMIATLRSEYNDVKRSYELESSKIEEVERNYNNYISQKERIDIQRDEKREKYEQRFVSNQTEIYDVKSKLDELKIDDCAEKVESITVLEAKLAQCDEKVHALLEENAIKKRDIQLKKEQYVKKGTDEEVCPVCLRAIEEHDKEHIDAEKAKLKLELEGLVEDVKELTSKINDIKNLKIKIQQLIAEKQRELSDLKLKKQRKKNLEDRLTQLESWQIELKIDLENVSNQNTEFDLLISETEQRLEQLRNSVSEISKKLSKLDIVKYIVSEEGVKSYIVKKLLELLNGKIQYYLKKLDVNFTCTFNEYFEEDILNENGKVCSYFNFSGAERKSIDLACLFAFSDMRRMQGGVSYNISIYDELFDSSFDEKGIDNIIELLKERVEEHNECTVVISHRKESLKAVTGDILFLEKSDGITRRVPYSEF